MKAAVLHEAGSPLSIEDVELPLLGADEALIKTMACGVCRTDLHLMEGALRLGSTPLILGHEAAGIIEDTGSQVEGWSRGDRILPYRYFTCGECYSCIAGNEQVCYKYRGQLGFSWNGGFAEYFKVPARALTLLPETLSFPDGATLACAGQTAYHAVKKRARITMGKTLLITGVGGVGLYALQYAKIAGATVFVADRSEKRLLHAETYGPDHLFNLTSKDFPGEVRRLTSGVGVDAVIDTTAVGEVIGVGLKTLRKGGRMVLVGSSNEGIAAITPNFLLLNEYEILGSRSSTRLELKEATSLAASSKIRSIVSRTLNLDQVNEALEDLKNGKIMGRATITF